MKKLSPETKTFKLFEALRQGEVLTPAEITKRFNIQNPRAEITRVRQSGYAVYAKREVAGNGREVTRYQMGMPSRRIVAAGYRAIAAGLV